jgi:hypothetical protein
MRMRRRTVKRGINQMPQTTELTRQQESVLLDLMDIHTIYGRAVPSCDLGRSQKQLLPTLTDLGLIEAQHAARLKLYKLSKAGRQAVTDLRRKNAAAYRRKQRTTTHGISP